jgi:hypothetical protein
LAIELMITIEELLRVIQKLSRVEIGDKYPEAALSPDDPNDPTAYCGKNASLTPSFFPRKLTTTRAARTERYQVQRVANA